MFRHLFILFVSLVVPSLGLTASSSIASTPAKSQANHDDHHDHHHDHGDHNHHFQHGSSKENGSSENSSSIQWPLLRTLGIYACLISAASLLGGWLPSRIRLSHVGFQSLLSVVGGMLLGIGVFHLLPHSFHELGEDSVDYALESMMVGIVTMFILLRTLHVHHHEPSAPHEDNQLTGANDSNHSLCSHSHSHFADSGVGKLGWAGMFLGLSIHTLLDGLALGAAMQSDFHHHPEGIMGLGVLVGIVLHKPLDSLSFTTLMMQAGKSRFWRIMINLIYSILCPLGAALFLLGVWTAGGNTSLIVGTSLAFSAGIFLCIALADLLPEMEFHNHHRWRLSLFLFIGIAGAWAIRFLEPAHIHQ